MNDSAGKPRGSLVDLLRFVIDNELVLRGMVLEPREHEQVDAHCTEIARIIERRA